MLDDVLRHLEALVSFDTRNPPRAIAAEGGLFSYLQEALPGFTHELHDHGAGAVSLLSTRGSTDRLFNFHVDTVPVADGWTRDPFQLNVADGRASALGACDIKGAAAAMVTAANRTKGPLALLFSSDEEANDARCISAFLKRRLPYQEAIVAEPTNAEAILAHRGIVSAHAKFKGVPGHASEARAYEESAVHRAVRWSAAALDYAKSFDAMKFDELSGFRFNLGTIAGGTKGNMIAGACDVRFGFRPLPSQSVDELIALFRNIAPPSHLESYEELFRGPPLPAGGGEKARLQMESARRLSHALGLTVGKAVNFWTEASLFSDAGMTALVYGPGDIAQAHAADEWVALEQLERVANQYARIIDA